MYRVTIYNDGTATIIHEISTDPSEPHLYSCTLTQGSSGEIDTLEFSVLPNNPGYSLLTSRTTLVEVYNSKTDKIDFSGRVLTITPEMQDSGLVFKSVVCESRLGYLCDSIQPYTEEATYTLEEFYKLLLANHNAQVEDYKKIYPGTITATASASTGNVTKALNYETTWSALCDKLLSTEGGEIELREGDDGLLYLDYVAELGEQVDTVAIELGTNMRSIAREIDPTSVVTRLIPLGAKLEDDEGNETEERLTIASVNDGVIYLDDEKSQATYGIVVGTVTWDDVAVASNLLTKGTQWLQQQSMTDKVSVTAYDLSLIGLAEDSIERNNYYQVVNSAIGTSRYYRVVKRTVNICEPSDIAYEMGERASSLGATIISTQKQAESESSERAAAIKRLANKLATSSGLYMTAEEQDDGSYIYYMHNMPTLAESDIVWKLTAEAFGISLDGGDTYPYGFTVTGEMVMALIYAEGINADYINSGTLRVTDSNGNIMFSADIDTGEVTINAATLTIKGTPTLTGATTYYALSSSVETLDDDVEWSQDMPARTSGAYIWSKIVYTYSDGTAVETTPVCISGLDGDSGTDGTSTEIAIEYYKSTSSTECVGGKWTTEAPEWEDGYYIWMRTTVTTTSGGNWTAWSGCTTASINVVADTTWDGMQVYCQVTDGDGNATLTDAITVTLGTAASPAITMQPTDRIVTAGDKVTFTIEAEGDDLSYLWYYLKSGSTSWGTWSPQPNNTLTVTSNNTWDGIQVYCQVTDGDGNTASSDVITITLGTASSPAIIAQPTNRIVASGDTVNFVLLAEGDDLSYQWYCKKTAGSLTTTSEAVCITGSPGTDGTGITSTEIAYQISSNGTTPPTDEWLNSIPSVSQGEYLWTRTVWTYSDGTTETMYSVSYTGEDGADGTSVNILGTAYTAESTYTAGNLYVLYSDSGLTTKITDAVAGDAYLVDGYLFVYSESDGTFVCTGVIRGEDGTGIVSIINYYLASSKSEDVTISTSGWTTTVQTVDATNRYLWNYEAVTLTDGNTDITEPCIIGVYSEDGVGIKSVTEYYAISTSNSDAPTIWSTIVQTIDNTNKYLWNYEVITYTDGSTQTTQPCVIGVYGDTGEAAITYYTWIKYADDENGTNMSDEPEGKAYIGLAYNQTTKTESTDPTDYAWSKIMGENGVDGTTYYTWVKYADDENGTGLTDDPTGKYYIGLAYNKDTPEESEDPADYTWSLFRGADGVDGADGKDGADGADGKDGTDGRGISSAAVTYQVSSTSGTTTPTGTWSASIPAVPQGSYLWVRTIFTYTDGTTATMYSVSYCGEDGSRGDDGTGIKSITNYYLATSESSGVTTSTSGWTTTVQAVDATNKYLWNYEIVALTDGNSDITTPIIIGMYSEDGTDGVGIASVTEYYAVSTSAATAPTSWYTTVQSMSSTNKYLWNYELITYTDGSTHATDKRVIGVYGDTGDAGSDGQMLYAICDTAASVYVKVAELTSGSISSLKAGVTVAVTFTYANTASAPALNVGGSTRIITVYGSPLTSGSMYNWVAGSTVQFVYDGTYWVMTETSALHAVGQWCYSNDTTYINGGMIATGTVTAEKLYVTELSAITGNVGELTAGTIHSTDYSSGNGTGFLIDLDNSIISSPYFTLNSDGASISGKIVADEGEIAGFTISETAIYNGTTSLTSSVAGIYVGTDGIRTVSSSNTKCYMMISDGALTGCAYDTANARTVGIKLGEMSPGLYFTWSDYTTYYHAYGFSVTGDGAVTGMMSVTGALYGSAAEFSSTLVANSITTGSTFIAPNAGGLNILDSSGNSISAVTLSSSNYFQFANGSVANSVFLGSYTYTSHVYIRASLGGVHLTGTEFYPIYSAGLTLGTSDHKWGQIYSTQSSISTSDENEKHDINDISEKYRLFFRKLRGVTYMHNGGDRVHVGLISQEVLAALEESGLTAEDFGGFCRDAKTAYAEYEEEGVPVESSKYAVVDEEGNPEYIYGLRYEEFIGLMIFVIQELDNRLSALEEA